MKKKFRSFQEARKFVLPLNLKKLDDWKNLYKSKKLPSDLPYNPAQVYKKHWKGWGDWLGTGKISVNVKSANWISWADAKPLYQKIAKDNKIKNRTEWVTYVKTHELPKGLPKYPDDVYSKDRILKELK